MALEINVESNISALTKAMDAFGKDQLPFATSKALNDTAFIVRNTIVKETFPRSFDVKNKRFAGVAFKVDTANKRKLEARVFDRLNKDYLALQESGGTKRPRGNSIAIPTDEIKVTGRGVTKARRPRQLLQSGKRAFRTKSKTGQDIIAQRRGKKRYPLKVLYVLEPQADIKPRFPFYAVGLNLAQKTFEKRLPIQLKEAKKDAFSKSRRRAARMR
tara:strand:+ start:574 stop:1221 length:648 start_codon:yes stop_codon:yes gene_type:complete